MATFEFVRRAVSLKMTSIGPSNWPLQLTAPRPAAVILETSWVPQLSAGSLDGLGDDMRFMIVLCLLIACSGKVDETTVELPEGFDCFLDYDRAPFRVAPTEGTAFTEEEIDVLATVFNRLVLGDLIEFAPSAQRPVLEVDLYLATSTDEDIPPDSFLVERLSTDLVIVYPPEDESRRRRVFIRMHGWVGPDSVYIGAKAAGWFPGSHALSRGAIVTREGGTWRVCPSLWVAIHN